MIKPLKEFLQYHFHHPNYLYFLVSLVLLIIIPPFSSILQVGSLFLQITFGGVIAMAVLYTTSSFKGFIFHGILGTLLYILFLLNHPDSWFVYIIPVLMLVFFFLTFKNIVYYIFRVKHLGLNEVYACVAGYLTLGIIMAPFFFLIEQTIPGSFVLPENSEFYDLIYFSYVTLTTVGFGDISPVHPIAKSLTILVAITGQLYMTIIVAIIIGKYLSYENKLNKYE